MKLEVIVKEIARLETEFADANDHLAACQVKLHKLGIECGADGSALVGIERLAEQRDCGWRQADRERAALRAVLTRARDWCCETASGRCPHYDDLDPDLAALSAPPQGKEGE